MANMWSPAQHGTDQGGYASFQQDSMAGPTSPGASPSSPGRRALNWFKRPSSNSRSREREEKRATSPNDRASRTPSPTFVVRNVTKQPGGVSIEAPNAPPGAYGYGSSSPQRRMTLDDSDEERGGQGSTQLQYSRSRSRPLAAGTNSLGVPPGGRGGGTGYGHAGSSNDGRPEGWERGRTPSADRGHSSPQQYPGQSRTSPARPASPGATTAGAFRATARVTNGPQSWSTQQQEREAARAAPQSTRSAQGVSLSRNGSRSPGGPRANPAFSSSPLSGGPASPLAPQMSTVNAGAYGRGHAADDARFAPGAFHPIPPHVDMSNGAPAVIPLDGLPSPISIPRSAGRDSAAPSPLGTPSPGRSPDGRSPAAGSPSLGGGAGKWMQKIFSRSPRAESPAAEQTYAGWSREPSPAIGTNQAPRAPYEQSKGRGWSASPAMGDDEREARLQRERSQREAARIVDEERRAVIDRPLQGYDPHTDKPFSPRQAIADPLDPDGVRDGRLERQTRSPPGRKPVPRFEPSQELPAPDELRRMSLGTREDLARQVDPHDALSRLEGRLTPAQQIIAETRSRHLARERQEQQTASTPVRLTTQMQRGFDVGGPESGTPAHGKQPSQPPTLPSKSPAASRRNPSDVPLTVSADQVETPVRRGSKRANARFDDAQAPGPATRVAPAAAAAAAAVTPQNPARATKQGAAPSGRNPAAAVGLAPGQGPLPMDMTLPQALQEMMVRFYKYERYSVPLIRSLETRLLDIERDAQMAINGDAASAHSSRDREMDRWVGQMTGLMRHEVGQLKAATREIREGRELLAQVVSRSTGTQPGSAFLPRAQSAESAVIADSSVSSTTADAGALPAAASPPKTNAKLIAAHAQPNASAAHGNRTNNISSASFNSAMPRADAGLELPPGAAPALDKDQGKSGPRGNASNSDDRLARGRERSTSPSGRPRFTSALGEPMQEGRLSPAERSPQPSERSLDPPPARRFEAADVGASIRPGAASPALSDAPSNASAGTSNTTRSRNARSIDDRLKALVAEKNLKSPSPSQTSIFQTADEDGENLRSFEAPPSSISSKIGSDYQLQGQDVVQEPEQDVLSVQDTPVAASRVQRRGKGASDTSQATYVPARSAAKNAATTSPSRRATLTAPVQAPSYIGGRTSPTPSSHSAHSSNARRSISPANFVPPTSGSGITTASNATQSLRARAQSYLLSTDGPGAAPNSSPSRSPTSPRTAASILTSNPGAANAANAPPLSPTPSSWLSGKGSTSPSKLGKIDTSATVLSSSPPKAVSPTRALSSSPKKSQLSPSKVSTLSASASGQQALPVQPLSFKKSASSIASKPDSSFVSTRSSGSGSATPANATSSSTLSSSTPGRKVPSMGKSLKERAAFFEAA
ncbi:hypothetical protein IE81DRAFT_72177 [Ceraceosorus guamensis]|uniref:Uncharacterized protein n=1 Tax=Ceraceosorus guamensis TaxID=1522189 RepID=A0A316W4M0_9BASI|nr:hypothetical protein IE81DRAFT_72177 [Ceraceosorus guamensis]PWN43601.1 hypothetical protein IE81DRAFT_72177 [Ceraceosorus guamensis]